VDSLKGTVERIVYHNEENHYTVARLKAEGGPPLRFRGAPPPLTTIVGNLPGLQVGETVLLEGEWAAHPQHGREFRVSACQPQLPATIEGIRRYLGSGLIKGIGPKTARAIVERFGEQTLDIIEEEPERLREVAGISAARARLITAAWLDQREIKALMLFLQSHGVSTGLAARIYQQYGNGALAVVRGNPYQLQQDMTGVGFHTADVLAQKLGLHAQSPARHTAGLRHVLSEAAEEGHVYLPREALLTRAAAALGCPEADLAPALEELTRWRSTAEERQAFVEDDRVYLPWCYRSERGVADLIGRLKGTPSTLHCAGDEPWETLTGVALSRAGIALAPAQRDAVRAALVSKVAVLTGGPGTGKTTTLRALIEVLEHYGVTYCLAAPTGRAAKRMSEATGRPAQTLHRLLQFSPGRKEYDYNEENLLPERFVVVDEASMLDIALTYNLLKAVAPTAHLLLVGDVDQLPSVGAGNVLRDLISSGAVPTVRLQTLFRQAQQSQIVVAAHAVNAGRLPQPRLPQGQDLSDFYTIAEEDAARALALLTTVVAERIPRRFGLDPLTAVQVISPMHRGPLGVSNLNETLQARLNPTRGSFSELPLEGRILRVGDRVMQVRNNYEKNVFNGDMGRIAAINREDQALSVEYPAEGTVATVGGTIPGVMREAGALYRGARRPQRPAPARQARATPLGPVVEVVYDFGELHELVLAYAISAHKSQGSEFAAVVLPLTMAHYTMLQRNLLYTAITRARQLCVIIGSPRALRRAVENNTVAQRYSGLAGRLSGVLTISGGSMALREAVPAP